MTHVRMLREEHLRSLTRGRMAIANGIARTVLVVAGAGMMLHLIAGFTLPLWQQITASLQHLH